MCGITRLLIPAFLVGLAVATLLGNDLAGWIAAGVTFAIVAGVQRVRGTGQTCAISLPPATDDRVDVENRDGSTDLPSP